MVRPETPLASNALLVNGRDQPSIGTEVKRELASADRVDLLCAFVKWYGLRVIEEELAELVRRRRAAGQPDPVLRVLTTTYMGATERRALDRLVELGAQVKISYETLRTRLHAKAWLFHRSTGFSTAYVGSSNLSRAALLDGVEWNVRLSQVDQAHLLDTFRATFDEYWEDPTFEPYDPADVDNRRRLDAALSAEHSGATDLPIELATFEVRPWGFQREILDELTAERDVHDNHRNLVVMATGTGKTVVAGLDYRRLRDSGEVDSLLFVAHRDEILKQSQTTFRHILRDGSFGERLVGGERPTEWRHVFASVQSLSRLDLNELDPKRFDMVIVDEFHHAGPEVATYARLLGH
jgi:HKD family nuclease